MAYYRVSSLSLCQVLEVWRPTANIQLHHYDDLESIHLRQCSNSVFHCLPPNTGRIRRNLPHISGNEYLKKPSLEHPYLNGTYFFVFFTMSYQSI